MILVYALGHISGAHFNPAVTVSFAIYRQFPLKQACYWSLDLLTLFQLSDFFYIQNEYYYDDFKGTQTQFKEKILLQKHETDNSHCPLLLEAKQ